MKLRKVAEKELQIENIVKRLKTLLQFAQTVSRETIRTVERITGEKAPNGSVPSEGEEPDEYYPKIIYLIEATRERLHFIEEEINRL